MSETEDRWRRFGEHIAAEPERSRRAVVEFFVLVAIMGFMAGGFLTAAVFLIIR